MPLFRRNAITWSCQFKYIPIDTDYFIGTYMQRRSQLLNVKIVNYSGFLLEQIYTKYP